VEFVKEHQRCQGGVWGWGLGSGECGRASGWWQFRPTKSNNVG
jgi:hypothetical protein